MRFGKQIRYKISQIIILITICFVSIYECELFESEQLSRRKKNWNVHRDEYVQTHF